MRKVRFLFVMLALLLSCSVMQAQFGKYLGKAVENAAKRTVERKTEEAVGKAIDKAIDPETNKDEDGGKSEDSKKSPSQKQSGNDAEGESDASTDSFQNVSKGQTVPIADNATDDGHAKNRRADTVASLSTGNIFFPTKEGLTLVYANLNAKGKADSYTRYIIRKVEGTNGNFSVNYVIQILNNLDDDAPIEIPYTITVNNGTVEFDMKSFVSPGTESFVEITGDKLSIPSSLSPGDKLDDVIFVMTLNMGFKIRTNFSLTEQECLAIEDVTVPAGTFKCHKVTQTSAVTSMRKTVTTKTVTWYAPGIGQVKGETYDQKGKLQTATELQMVEN